MFVSERPGHLTELAAAAVAGGATRLVVVGGDGSVHEAVNGIAGVEGVELAVIPRGTGWDFVRSFGISRRLEDAVATALTGDIREIDLGRATFRTWAGGEGGAYFANVGSAGISGAIARRANEASKALGGKISYYWATLAVFFGWQTGRMRVTVDGEVREGRMIDVVVANGRFIGGGMMLCPEALPDDHPRLEVLRGRRVTVEADEPLPIELDGEQPGRTPVHLEIVPRALRLRVPRA